MYKIIFKQNSTKYEKEFCICKSLEEATSYRIQLEKLFDSISEYKVKYDNFFKYDKNVFNISESNEISKVYQKYLKQDRVNNTTYVESHLDRLFLENQIKKLFELKGIQYKYTENEIKLIESIIPYFNYEILIEPIENNINLDEFSKLVDSITQDKFEIVNPEYNVMNGCMENNMT